MTIAHLTLSSDATVTERLLLHMLRGLLKGDEAAYQAWITDAHTLCDDMTDREFALFDLTDAVAEHFDDPNPEGGLPGWRDYCTGVFAASAV